MRVELKSLKPNPMRDFTIDPIDDDRVATLVESIKEDGFWGGVVCRKVKRDGIEVAAGWHRVQAAIKAGIREADLFVSEFDDGQMIRIYARENATQRGNVGTALAGSVAAAVRFLVKAVLTGATPEIRSCDLDQVNRHLTSDRGLGEPIVSEFLSGVPGINKSTVGQQLANIKASGDYARIVREVQEEIEEDNRERLKALEKAEREQATAEEAALKAEAERKEAAARAKKAREEAEIKRTELARQKAEADAKLAEKRRKEAEEQMKQFDALRTTRDTARKAADKAEQREKTFDFEGVAKHLKTASHIDVFRELATGEGARPYLPVNKQAALAKELVKLCDGNELSGRFIREHFMSMLDAVRGLNRRFDTEERADILRKDWNAKAKSYQDDFARNARGLLAAGIALSDHAKKRPSGVTLHLTSEFIDAVDKVQRAVALIKKAGML